MRANPKPTDSGSLRPGWGRPASRWLALRVLTGSAGEPIHDDGTWSTPGFRSRPEAPRTRASSTPSVAALTGHLPASP